MPNRVAISDRPMPDAAIVIRLVVRSARALRQNSFTKSMFSRVARILSTSRRERQQKSTLSVLAGRLLKHFSSAARRAGWASARPAGPDRLLFLLLLPVRTR